MRESQLDLFAEPKTIVKNRYYKDLTIHERINVKANSLIFAGVFIHQLRPGFDKICAISRYEHPEAPQWERIELHNKLNPTSMDTILQRKEDREKLKL